MFSFRRSFWQSSTFSGHMSGDDGVKDSLKWNRIESRSAALSSDAYFLCISPQNIANVKFNKTTVSAFILPFKMHAKFKLVKEHWRDKL